MTKLASPVKYHGSKGGLAAKIVATFPAHSHYLETHAGSLAVLLAKNPEGVAEIVNDIDERVSTFWTVMRTPPLYRKFKRLCEATAFSDKAYAEACEYHVNDRSERRAWRFFVMSRMSLAGRLDAGFTPLTRTRTRRGMSEQTSSWLTAIDGLEEVHDRLKRVVVVQRDACDIAKRQDDKSLLVYMDPPYHPSTVTDVNVYRHAMTEDDHLRLLRTAVTLKAKVAISAYRCEAYDRELAGWRRLEFEVANHAAGGKKKRRMTECLYVSW